MCFRVSLLFLTINSHDSFNSVTSYLFFFIYLSKFHVWKFSVNKGKKKSHNFTSFKDGDDDSEVKNEIIKQFHLVSCVKSLDEHLMWSHFTGKHAHRMACIVRERKTIIVHIKLFNGLTIPQWHEASSSSCSCSRSLIVATFLDYLLNYW